VDSGLLDDWRDSFCSGRERNPSLASFFNFLKNANSEVFGSVPELEFQILLNAKIERTYLILSTIMTMSNEIANYTVVDFCGTQNHENVEQNASFVENKSLGIDCNRKVQKIITKGGEANRKCEKGEERNLWLEKFSFCSLQCSQTTQNTSHALQHNSLLAVRRRNWIWRQTARESQFRTHVTFFYTYIYINFVMWISLLITCLFCNIIQLV